jgi:DNA-binding NarL/FixJ family response regulator
MAEREESERSGDFAKRVLVVEDQPLMRHSLTVTLGQAGYEVRDAADAGTAVGIFDGFDPDGLLIDIDLGPGLDGLLLLEALRARKPVVPAVVLTRFSDPRLAGSPLKPDSITAFITKQRLDDSSRLTDALAAVIGGTSDGSFRDDIGGQAPGVALTETQISVLELVAAGLTDEQIAGRRGISKRAVQTAVSRALAAMDVSVGPDQNQRVIATRAYLAAIGLLPPAASVDSESV